MGQPGELMGRLMVEDGVIAGAEADPSADDGVIIVPGFIDVHVLVDPRLSVVEGHRVSMEVEEAIRAACRLPINVTVHIEPQLDELASHHAET